LPITAIFLAALEKLLFWISTSDADLGSWDADDLIIYIHNMARDVIVIKEARCGQ
jgi:hypothetical protein